MVVPACYVAANLWIDDIAIFQSEVEGVWIVGVVRSAFPGDAFAGVFDDAHAFANEPDRIDAPTMHSRLADFNLDGRRSSSTFFCHTTCRISLALLSHSAGFYSSIASSSRPALPPGRNLRFQNV